MWKRKKVCCVVVVVVVCAQFRELLTRAYTSPIHTYTFSQSLFELISIPSDDRNGAGDTFSSELHALTFESRHIGLLQANAWLMGDPEHSGMMNTYYETSSKKSMLVAKQIEISKTIITRTKIPVSGQYFTNENLRCMDRGVFVPLKLKYSIENRRPSRSHFLKTLVKK